MSGVYICFPVIHAILTSCLCQKSVSWGDVAADGLDRELLEMMRLRYSHCAKVCRSFWANIPPKTPEQHEKVVVEDLRLSAVVPLGPEFCILSPRAVATFVRRNAKTGQHCSGPSAASPIRPEKVSTLKLLLAIGEF